MDETQLRRQEGTTQFETYRDFHVPVKRIADHQMLALRRGEAKGFLNLTLAFDDEYVLEYLASREIRTPDASLHDFLLAMLKDAFDRLMKNALVGDVRLQKKHFCRDIPGQLAGAPP